MRKINRDVDNILSLKEKEELLKQIDQLDLLDLFKKNYKPSYKPISAKKACLDQQLSIAIAQDEKDYIGKELLEIKKLGSPQSISAFIRNRAIIDLDIAEWYEKAVEGLEILTSSKYNIKEVKKQKMRYIKLLDDLDINDKETEFYYNKQIDNFNKRIKELERKKPQRKFRICGRVTFNEANIIRWRAAKLSLTIADYMRFMVFGYRPFSDADKHLPVESRKRFYISIMDVYKNGWGEIPEVENCPNCARYLKDVEILKKQLGRYQTFTKNKR